MRLPARHVLITGASDGIGRALVDHYDRLGWQITATGRRKASAIARPLPPSARYHAIDLEWKEAPGMIRDIVGARLDLAILNAGTGRWAAPAAHSAADIARAVATNVTVPLLTARALRPALLAGNGAVAFIGSSAARGRQPKMAVYTATKAALDGATRALRLEWTDVPVLMLHPGPTATEMHAKAGLTMTKAHLLPTAEETATALARAIAARRSRVRHGALFLARHALAKVGRA
ncbi:MAG: SDR family NAD(P)-dependent oxidoreductase [Shimia sp.]